MMMFRINSKLLGKNLVLNFAYLTTTAMTLYFLLILSQFSMLTFSQNSDLIINEKNYMLVGVYPLSGDRHATRSRHLGFGENTLEVLQELFHAMNSQENFQILPIIIDGSTDLFIGGTRLSSMMVSREMFDFSGLDDEMASGRLFTHEESYVKEGQPIPVIIGHHLSVNNQIGDRFEANFFDTDTFEFEIIGIMSENEGFLRVTGFHQNLDSMVIVPFLNFSQYGGERDARFEEQLYFERLFWTPYFVENETESIIKMMNEVHVNLRYFSIDYEFLGVDPRISSGIETVNLLMNQRHIIMTLFIGTVISILGIQGSIVSYKYKMREKDYRILCLAGVPAWKISLNNMFEITVLSSLAVFLTTYYLIYHSGLIIHLEALHLFQDRPVLEVFLGAIERFPSVFHTLIYGGLLLLISLIYPIVKTHALYKNPK